jgi:HD superfamily phosphohydrolase
MLIRDPVHGDITLSALEAQVMDLPEVQRLRGIKQLGTASLVYPGCVHTRFDHSLGVSALAKRLLREIAARGTGVDADVAQAVSVAALLHDVTHLPFGHTLEDERCLFPRHDKGERMRKLFEGALGNSLDRLGVKDTVAAVLGLTETGTGPPPWAGEVVSSTVDADLLDYLRRDSYFAGLAHDYDDRVFSHFIVDGDRLAIDMTKHGMERPDARSETVQLLRMRYFLTERVYYHHTKVAAGAMISKAVEMAHEHGALGEDELLHLNDWSLLERLRQVPRGDNADARIVRLVDRLERRALLKRGYVISAHSVPAEKRARLVDRFHGTARERRQAEQQLASEIDCNADEVIVYCPALTVMKEAAVLVRTPQGLVPLNEADRTPNSEVLALQERYASLWRLYVFVPEEFQARATAAAQDVFGFPSEHRPG